MYTEDLKKAPDYEVLESYSERYYAGPEGPYYRDVPEKVMAFGKEWISRQTWTDKARDIGHLEWRTAPNKACSGLSETAPESR